MSYSRRLERSILQRLLSYTVGLVFNTTPSAAALRRWGLILLGGVSWALFAWVSNPFRPGLEPLRRLVEYPFRALFAGDVFAVVLIAALSFWLAFRFAAIYLDDIFELNAVSIAGRYIRQSAFASQYDVIRIKDGDVIAEDRRSPIFLIGGPGRVHVFMENAAVFEKVSGEPRVIAPTMVRETNGGNAAARLGSRRWLRELTRDLLPVPDENVLDEPPPEEPKYVLRGATVLEGFERLRSVIDLRDQVEDMSASDRTRDGIRIMAKDVRFVFSVLRDSEEPTLERPYPFTDEAIRALVFNQTGQNWTNSMRSSINSALGQFISRHDLNEFLADVNAPMLLRDYGQLQWELDREQGVPGPAPPESASPPGFEARSALTNLFYDFASRFSADSRKRGIELRWIGVGTWDLPAEVIANRHQEAWRITFENRVRGSRRNLDSLFEESRVMELHRKLLEVPLGRLEALNAQFDSFDTIARRMLMAYRDLVCAALDQLNRAGKGGTPDAMMLQIVCEFLKYIPFHYVSGQNNNGS